jgi:hypothetical protein
MKGNEYSQYAFKKLTTQDTYMSVHTAKKSFSIGGSSLPNYNIYVFPFEN